MLDPNMLFDVQVFASLDRGLGRFKYAYIGLVTGFHVIEQQCGIVLDPNMLFDVQVKRIPHALVG